VVGRYVTAPYRPTTTNTGTAPATAHRLAGAASLRTAPH